MTHITALVHERMRRILQPGDWAVDATLGNGFDAEMLVDCVAPGGRVFGLDVQERALEKSQALLGSAPEFLAILGDHAALDRHLPLKAKHSLRAVVFNLGYLPGGDRRLMTHEKTTLPALDKALDWLAPGGVLSCTCYPGTEGGALEARAVSAWLRGLDGVEGRIARSERIETPDPGPFTLWLEKH